MQDDQLKREKDNADWERNQLVAALSKMFPSYLAKHPEEDKDWDDNWRTIVVVYVYANDSDSHFRAPGRTYIRIMGQEYYQLTWHIHDSEISMFDHLTYQTILNDAQMNQQNRISSYDWNNVGFVWDGHTTEEKYRRLRTLNNGYLVTQTAKVEATIHEARAKGKANGEKIVRAIADQELIPADLPGYERLVLSEELKARTGYPKGERSRKIFDQMIQAIVQYHRQQIANTHEEESRDGMVMENSPYDPRVTRV